MLSDTDTFAFTAIAANLGKMRSSLLKRWPLTYCEHCCEHRRKESFFFKGVETFSSEKIATSPISDIGCDEVFRDKMELYLMRFNVSSF